MKNAIIVAAVVAAFSTGTSVLADSGKPPLNGHFRNGKPSLGSQHTSIAFVDQGIVPRHRALGRLPQTSVHALSLAGVKVAIDQAILRRHQALGRLPGVVPSTAAQSKLKGNTT